MLLQAEQAALDTIKSLSGDCGTRFYCHDDSPVVSSPIYTIKRPFFIMISLLSQVFLRQIYSGYRKRTNGLTPTRSKTIHSKTYG